MDHLLSLYQYLISISKANPLLGAAIGMWFVAVPTYLMRNLPKKLLELFKRTFVWQVSLNNMGYGGNEMNFIAFFEWFMKTKYAYNSQNVSLETTWKDDAYEVIKGPGYGIHHFWYKGRLFWFEKRKVESQGTSAQKEEIILNGLTRNSEIVDSLIDEFRYRKVKGEISGLIYGGNEGWRVNCTIPLRNLDTIAIDEDILNDIITTIETHLKSKDWYRQNGLPNKLTIILEGPTGTGKSSLIRGIATYFKKDVCMLDLGELGDSKLRDAMMTAPKGSIVAIEDFDKTDATRSRDIAPHPTEVKVKPKESGLVDMLEIEPVSLSGFLNAMDGIIPLDDIIVIKTTNKLENIDPAVIRPGRVDRIFKIGHLRDKDIRTFIQRRFPNLQLPDPEKYTFDDISGAELSQLYSDNRFDQDTFLKAVPGSARIKMDWNKVVGALGIGDHIHGNRNGTS